MSNTIVSPQESLHLNELVLLASAADRRTLCEQMALRVASSLLNDFALRAGSRLYRLAEIEFYFTTPPEAHHDDPFTHCDELQNHLGYWYFHRTGSGYKGGSYKGLDVSLGQGGGAGGLLIRGLRSMHDGELISGPSLCVDRLLVDCGHDSVAELVDALQSVHCRSTPTERGALLLAGLSVSDAHSPLRLIPLRTGATDVDGSLMLLAPEPVYRSPRVGLYLTKKKVPAQQQADFFARAYRFVLYPWLLPKGRSLLAAQLYLDGENAERIQQIISSSSSSSSSTGSSSGSTSASGAGTEKPRKTALSTVRKWIQSVELGKEKRADGYDVATAVLGVRL
eukprot:CAMPEP_0177655732 /NCGR_PEP_ID=MMETSP0447-20121125/15145_1 /TAXON_ID=0 /ORGANISM="Stygamoeba regulata, Strain BSH-02190019" /LENGTH=337 /DNA_ID=CAMNT_0019159713 /DNA_START=45 /DNA_END=1055 /DNA_ORIENTATION=-